MGELELYEEGKGHAVLAVAEIRCPAGDDGAGSAGVAAGRGDAAWAGEIGDVGVAVVVLQAVGEVLAGHVVRGDGGVPGLVLVAGILGEAGRTRGGDGSVDGRQEDEVASGVVDLAAAYSEAVAVVIEPDAFIDHVAEKALLGAVPAVAKAADTAAGFAADVGGDGGGGFADEGGRAVVVFVFDAVFGVVASAAGDAEGIAAYSVLIAEDGPFAVGTIEAR